MADDRSALYREAILAHARHPRNAGRLEAPSLRGSAHNPLCGDELEVTLALDGAVIRAVRVQVRGCVIAQAAASMMSEAVHGLPLARAAELGQAFRRAMDEGAETLPAELDALAPLLEVRRHRSRIRCAVLAWEPIMAFGEA